MLWMSIINWTEVFYLFIYCIYNLSLQQVLEYFIFYFLWCGFYVLKHCYITGTLLKLNYCFWFEL